MAAVFGHDQTQMFVCVRIRRKARTLIHLERNEGVVLRLNQQGGHANSVQENDRGLRRVIVLGTLESEGRRRDPVIEFIKSFAGVESGGLKATGGEYSLPHPVDKAPLVKAVFPIPKAFRPSSKIDRSRNGTDARNQIRFPEFARELQ
jgi:hypothetical protein